MATESLSLNASAHLSSLTFKTAPGYKEIMVVLEYLNEHAEIKLTAAEKDDFIFEMLKGNNEQPGFLKKVVSALISRLGVNERFQGHGHGRLH